MVSFRGASVLEDKGFRGRDGQGNPDGFKFTTGNSLLILKFNLIEICPAPILLSIPLLPALWEVRLMGIRILRIPFKSREETREFSLLPLHHSRQWASRGRRKSMLLPLHLRLSKARSPSSRSKWEADFP